MKTRTRPEVGELRSSGKRDLRSGRSLVQRELSLDGAERIRDSPLQHSPLKMDSRLKHVAPKGG